jgi:hypothetical protein
VSQEILYTSAAAGLKRGSHGFCTVVSTAGMAQNLAQQLEMLSGYRHAFPLNDPRAALNPVNYSHLILPLAGRRYHVLSRIADAGVDYTQRSNKTAHHVALEESERVTAGPAAVLATPGFCESTWDGTARILPSGRTPSNRPESTGPCVEWKAVTGDAGWAGVVAHHLISEREKPISLIFPAGTETLRLTEEILRLIPEGRRWDVTFSTYFTKLPAGLQCQLRFVLDGTPEATALRRHPHVAVLDLCTDLGPAETNGLVEIARVGRPSVARPTQRMPGSPPPQPATSSALEVLAAPQSYAIAPPPRPRRRRRSRSNFDGERPDAPPGRKRTLRTILLVMIPLIVVFSLSVGGVFLFRHFANSSPNDSETAGSSSPKRDVDNPFGLAALDKKTATATARKPANPAAPLPKTPRNTGNPAKPIVHGNRPPPPRTEPKPALESKSHPVGDNKKRGISRRTAVAALRPRRASKQFKTPRVAWSEPLDLPAAPTSGFGGGAPLDSKVLRSLPKGSELTLRIVPPSKAERDMLQGAQFELRRHTNGMARWDVILKKTTNSQFTTFERPVGQFMLDNDQLTFKWHAKVHEHVEDQLFRFRRMRLRLKGAGSEDTTTELTAPASGEPISLATIRKSGNVPLPLRQLHKKGISGSLLARLEKQLYCDAWLSFPRMKTTSKKVTIRFENESDLHESVMKDTWITESPLSPTARLACKFTKQGDVPELSLTLRAQVVVVEFNERATSPDKMVALRMFPRKQKSDWHERNMDRRLSRNETKMMGQFDPRGKRDPGRRLFAQLQKKFDNLSKTTRKPNVLKNQVVTSARYLDDLTMHVKKMQYDIDSMPPEVKSASAEKRKAWEKRASLAHTKRRAELIVYIKALIQLRKRLVLASKIAAKYQDQNEYLFQERERLSTSAVHYRIYWKVGNREIDLLKSK